MFDKNTKIINRYKLNRFNIYLLKTKYKNTHIIDRFKNTISFVVVSDEYLNSLNKIGKNKNIKNFVDMEYIVVNSIYDIGVKNVDVVSNINVFIDKFYNKYNFNLTVNKPLIDNIPDDILDIIVFKKCKQQPYIINHLQSMYHNNDDFYSNLIQKVDKNFIVDLVREYKIDYINKKFFNVSFNQLLYLIKKFKWMFIDENIDVFYSFDVYPYISCGYEDNLYIIPITIPIENGIYNFYKTSGDVKTYESFVNNHLLFKYNTVRELRKYGYE